MEVKIIEELLARNGFILDRYLAFYLKNRLFNTLQLDVYFPKEKMSFKCSSYEIVLESNSFTLTDQCKTGNDRIVISDLFSFQKIIKYLNEVAKFDTGYKYGLIQIGYIEQPINCRLMCSCQSADLGAVYLESPDDGTQHRIAENIILLFSQGEILVHNANIKRFNGYIQNITRGYNEDTWIMNPTNH